MGLNPPTKIAKAFSRCSRVEGLLSLDALFRAGDSNSNHGQDVEKMLRRIVAGLRKHYRAELPIVLRMDSGFFDQKLFKVFEGLQIGFIKFAGANVGNH